MWQYIGNYILEKASAMGYRVEDRPALTDVVITPRMIHAGVREFCEHDQFDASRAVECIFQAMWAAGAREGSLSQTFR
jgi:hypothetical protein